MILINTHSEVWHILSLNLILNLRFPTGGAVNSAGQPMSSIDWLDSLKDGIRLASSYNWDHANTDLTQFQGTHTSRSFNNTRYWFICLIIFQNDMCRRI